MIQLAVEARLLFIGRTIAIIIYTVADLVAFETTIWYRIPSFGVSISSIFRVFNIGLGIENASVVRRRVFS